MGINGGEWVVLIVLAFLLIGPERLPEVAQQLGRLTRELKHLATGAKEKVREELGPEMDDLAVFDPRQYDPRRIVREALMEDEPSAAVRPARPAAARRRPTPRAAAGGAVAGAAAAAGAASGAAVVPPVGTRPAGAVTSPAAPAAPATPAGSVSGEGASGPVAGGDATTAHLAATHGPADAGGPGEVAAPAPYVVPFDDEAT